MTDMERMMAEFHTKGKQVTKVPEGFSQIAKDKEAAKAKKAAARGRREYAELRADDKQEYEALLRDNARFP